MGYDTYFKARTVHSYLRFDVSALPPERNPSQTTLRLYMVSSLGKPETYIPIGVKFPQPGWTESQLTWNNRPVPGALQFTQMLPHAVWGWHEIDLGYPYSVPDIMLEGGTEPGWRGFATREAGLDYAPHLIVRYVGPPPRQTTSNLSTTEHLRHSAGALELRRLDLMPRLEDEDAGLDWPRVGERDGWRLDRHSDERR